MAKSKLKKFTVEGYIKLMCTTEIMAETMQQAAEQSTHLRADDFVDFKGEHNDSSLEINSIYVAEYPTI